MKKKEVEIGKNVSSGAEKVEVIEKKTKTTGKTNAESKKANPKKVALADVTLGTKTQEDKTYETNVGEEKIVAKKVNTQSSSGKAERESAAAKARVEKALKRKELKEKRKEEKAKKAKAKAEAKAKKAAAKKALLEKKAAQRKALAEKRAAEREEKIRERAHAKANRKQAQARKQKEKEKSRKNKKNEGRESKTKGYGGWIAAVVSLGVVTLALATTVTVGAIEMSRTSDMVMSSYRGTMYELTETIENIDEDLDRIRISNSATQQSRILTDILVQARLAEADLEKMPLTAQQDENITMFINRTAMQSERMLAKLRRGEKLSEEDHATLERIYETNHAVRAELDKLLNEATDKDWSACMKNGTGKVSDTLNRLENATLEENRATFKMPKLPKLDMPKKEGEGTQTMPAMPQEKPQENGGMGIQPARAEELCKQYFSDYGIKDFQCTGEAVGKGYKAYNVQGYDDKGTMLFAEIDRESGNLIRFDYFEECSGEKFDLEKSELIAERFLERFGYDDMEVVRFSKNGSTTDFTFVYEDDDVVYYPQTVRIKVCGTRGIVSGMDASEYLKNEGGRYEFNAALTLAEAKENLYKELSVESARAAVVKAGKGVRSAYEFLCGYEDESYFVFIDANSGEEIAIVNAKSLR